MAAILYFALLCFLVTRGAGLQTPETCPIPFSAIIKYYWDALWFWDILGFLWGQEINVTNTSISLSAVLPQDLPSLTAGNVFERLK